MHAILQLFGCAQIVQHFGEFVAPLGGKHGKSQRQKRGNAKKMEGQAVENGRTDWPKNGKAGRRKVEERTCEKWKNRLVKSGRSRLAESGRSRYVNNETSIRYLDGIAQRITEFAPSSDGKMHAKSKRCVEDKWKNRTKGGFARISSANRGLLQSCKEPAGDDGGAPNLVARVSR